MPDRTRHTIKEYEALLQSLERQGWRVRKAGNNHFKTYCPNECLCRPTIPSTPSASQSLTKHTTHLKNHTCWEMDL